jgi:hypothetical protein
MSDFALKYTTTAVIWLQSFKKIFRQNIKIGGKTHKNTNQSFTQVPSKIKQF